MRRHPAPLALGVLIALVVVALQALLVPLFAGPAANIAPRDLPIAVAGPPPAATGVADKLAAEHPGAFDVQVVADGTAADAAIKNRDGVRGHRAHRRPVPRCTSHPRPARPWPRC